MGPPALMQSMHSPHGMPPGMGRDASSMAAASSMAFLGGPHAAAAHAGMLGQHAGAHNPFNPTGAPGLTGNFHIRVSGRVTIITKLLNLVKLFN